MQSPSQGALTKRACSRIRHLLINHRFRPAAQVSPHELAEGLRVSVTPIREALHRFAGERLINFIPNKGFYSKVLDLQEMIELSALRYELLRSAIAAGLGLPTIPSSWSENSNFAFHSHSPNNPSCVEQVFVGIASASSNRSLVEIIDNLNDRTHYIRSLDLESPARWRDAALHIQLLIAHVRGQNVSSALDALQAEMERHVSEIPHLVKEGLLRAHASPACSELLSELPARA